MKMKKRFALALALCMVFALCACGSSSAKSEKLVFGTSADYPPYEFIYVNDKGEQEYAGIDVWLAQQIAADMGKELEVVNMSFDSLMAAVNKGDVDVVLAAIEENEERLAAADFSDPYIYPEGGCMILVQAANAGNFTSAEDFAGKSIGAQTGTTKVDIVTELGGNLVGETVVTDLVNELVYGKVDAIVLDYAVGESYLASNSDLASVEVEGVGAALPYEVAVQKGDPKGLLDSINKTIAKVLADGSLDQAIADAEVLQEQSIT